MAAAFGAEQEAVVARELTKRFETVRLDTLGALCQWFPADADQRKGEFVILVRGHDPAPDDEVDADTRRVLKALLVELPPAWHPGSPNVPATPRAG